MHNEQKIITFFQYFTTIFVLFVVILALGGIGFLGLHFVDPVMLRSVEVYPPVECVLLSSVFGMIFTALGVGFPLAIIVCIMGMRKLLFKD